MVTGCFGMVGRAWLLLPFICSTGVALASGPSYSANELRKLIAYADAVLYEADAQDGSWREDPRKAFENMSVEELKAHFSEPPGYVTSRERRGWTVARRLAGELLSKSGDNEVVTQNLVEVLEAISNAHRRPVPSSINCLQPPILFLKHLHHPIARGELLATNLRTNVAETDPGRLDPAPSTFWERPASIAAQDLHAGFGRSALPWYETNLWEYAGPKTSWGTWPGFDLRCGELEIKVKLAETRSEPFTARIFHALGFHADATDHAPYLKINYSRRLFREFHLRKDLTTDIRAPGLRMYTFNFQKRYDPFRFITEAVLKDGRRLTGTQLKAFLLRDLES